MSKTLRNVGLAALLAISASALMPGQASALSMAECSAKYSAAKAANTLNGMKWNDFRKAQCGTDANAAAPAAAAKPAKAAKATATAPAATAPAAATAAAPATTPSGSFMKDCAASWKAMKAANTVPAGMAWKDFVAAKCQVAGAPAAAPAAAATAAKPTVSPPEPADKADAAPLATTDKNGKPYTPGQMAAHQRIRACGDEYRTLKAANKLPANIAALDPAHRWPQYWSMCNAQMKAKGQ